MPRRRYPIPSHRTELQIPTTWAICGGGDADGREETAFADQNSGRSIKIANALYCTGEAQKDIPFEPAMRLLDHVVAEQNNHHLLGFRS
jgi:hypothetical protein